MFAFLAGFGETGGGLLLALGFLTPLGCAGDHRDAQRGRERPLAEGGPWATNGGYEYPLTLAVVAAGLAGSPGRGRFSVDHALGLHLHGIRWGLAAVGVGLASAAVTLATPFQGKAETHAD